MNWNDRWNKMLCAAGGLVWMACGVALSSRPAGQPPESFRATADIMPVLVFGLLMIGIGSGLQIRQFRENTNGLVRLAPSLLIFGAVSYTAGSIVRFGLFPGKWEPLMPMGFLAVILGFFFVGVGLLRSKGGSTVGSCLYIFNAASLLSFNDQYTPWVGLPFGLSIVASVFVLRPGGKTGNHSGTCTEQSAYTVMN